MPASLNDTPSSERVHIGLFGCRNAGKSSLINALTGQNLAIVSDYKGTTTDPVSKAMEILPLGPVLITDTPGLDDDSLLGEKRIEKARLVLRSTDIALLVVDASIGMSAADKTILAEIRSRSLPYLIIYNKVDLVRNLSVPEQDKDHIMVVSAVRHEGITELKDRLAAMAGKDKVEKPLLGDLLSPGDLVVLVVPIDESAPKGRLILPQQMMIRGILDADGIPVCVKQDRLKETLERLGTDPVTGRSPAELVITDSQVFEEVAQIVPRSIPLTSFSILMARYKGFLDAAVSGVKMIDRLKDGDRILISEGCTHHRQCGDIGTVKLPAWIRKRTGADITFETSSGGSFPEDLSRFAMVIHCGGCMLNEREMRFRMKCAADQGIPFTNYGTAIAYMKGILDRSTEIV